MPKRNTEELRAFRERYARMVSDFRQWHEAPLILIGKATLTLFDCGVPVTPEAIRECVAGLTAPEDADLVARTLEYLDEHLPSSDNGS